MSEPKWLNRKEAAAHLRAHGFPVSHRTLARLADEGPPYRLFLNHFAVYEADALLEWANSKTKARGRGPVVAPTVSSAPA